MWHRRYWHNRQWNSRQWKTTLGLASLDTGDEPAYVDLFAEVDTALDAVFGEQVVFQRLGQSPVTVTGSLMTEQDDDNDDANEVASATVRATWLLSASDLGTIVPRAGDRLISAGRQYEVLPDRGRPAAFQSSRRQKILVRAKRVT